MPKERAGRTCSLSKAIREARRQRGWTQAELAERAGFVERTARALEHGRGNIDTFQRALEALDLRLYFRNAPQVSISEVIRLMRSRRQFSQRELARVSEVSHPTIASLERSGSGQLAPLERILTTLGAGAYLAPIGQPRAFFTHAGNASVGMAWATPAALLGVHPMPSRTKPDRSSEDLATRCARRCVDIISSLLRPEEYGEAVREFRAAIEGEIAEAATTAGKLEAGSRDGRD